MNLRINKHLLLSALLCSVVFAATIVFIGFSEVSLVTDNSASHGDAKNFVTLAYINDHVDGGYTTCGGDPVGGGGHP